MDREWRDLLVKRRSGDRQRGASFWGFVTGDTAEDSDAEYSLVVGERLDEMFFREMKTRLAKGREEVSPAEQARWNDDAEAQAASATLRAALITMLANQNPQESSGDFWQTMAAAAEAPIGVSSQGAASGAGGGSGTVVAGSSSGTGEGAVNPAQPYSSWSGPTAGYSAAPASGTVNGGFPTPTMSVSFITMSHPSSGNFVTQSGHGASYNPAISFHGNVIGSHVMDVSSSSSIPVSTTATLPGAPQGSATAGTLTFLNRPFQVAAIPEPGCGLLFVMGMGGVMGWRRRKG